MDVKKKLPLIKKEKLWLASFNWPLTHGGLCTGSLCLTLRVFCLALGVFAMHCGVFVLHWESFALHWRVFALHWVKDLCLGHFPLFLSLLISLLFSPLFWGLCLALGAFALRWLFATLYKNIDLDLVVQETVIFRSGLCSTLTNDAEVLPLSCIWLTTNSNVNLFSIHRLPMSVSLWLKKPDQLDFPSSLT